jgi:hypothetical protein
MLARPAESLTAANALPGGIPERLVFSARRAALQRYAFVSQKPLEPPPSFSFDLCALLSEPRVWLRDGVGLMTFGAFCDIEDTKFRRAYERNRAAKPIFEAARRAELSLIGCLRERGDDTIAIPSHYFDLPRTLGNIDNSIEIVNDAIPDEDFYTRREDSSQTYRHVRTDTTTFKKWLGTLTSK